MQNILEMILADLNGTISLPELLLSVAVACVIALFILFIYRKTYTGVVYSNSFAMSIILLAMVTSIITCTISSNMALSLGMVGALSIVRFRTAVKEPLDTAFMFWAIAAGIMTGAGMYLPSIFGSLLVGLLYMGCYAFGFRLSRRYLLIIKYSMDAESTVLAKVESIKNKKLRSQTAYGKDVEVTYELEVKDVQKESVIITEIQQIQGVKSCSFVAYQNDFGD
ncbi:MAG: DUF4956 domain-containing protein [Erysipelotrichaceae bacterium]|nr:DUF4956 domain-containing protein [Erysipelotrichaceae bacterium]